jgi:hypothetical protein
MHVVRTPTTCLGHPGTNIQARAMLASRRYPPSVPQPRQTVQDLRDHHSLTCLGRIAISITSRLECSNVTLHCIEKLPPDPFARDTSVKPIHFLSFFAGLRLWPLKQKAGGRAHPVKNFQFCFESMRLNLRTGRQRQKSVRLLSIISASVLR